MVLEPFYRDSAFPSLAVVGHLESTCTAALALFVVQRVHDLDASRFERAGFEGAPLLPLHFHVQPARSAAADGVGHVCLGVLDYFLFYCVGPVAPPVLRQLEGGLIAENMLASNVADSSRDAPAFQVSYLYRCGVVRPE